MSGEFFRRKDKSIEIDKLREKVIHAHKFCSGTGFVSSKIKDKTTGFLKEIVRPCKCTEKFELKSKFIISNIPYQALINQQIYEKSVRDELAGKKINLRKEIIRPCIESMATLCQNPFGLTLLGKNGTGKTFIGQKLLYYAIIHGFTAHYIEFSHLLNLIRKNFNKENLDGLINEILSVDFLLIDEVGNESKRSDFAISELKSLYKGRILRDTPTFLISNFSYLDFKKVYGVSIDNLVSSYSKILDFIDAPDIRKIRTSVQTEAFFSQLKKRKKK